MRAEHEFGPFFRADSEILILGSFPSVKSRDDAFYYAHPQNRFWRVLAACLGERVPEDLAEKQELLVKHKIALWDVIEECEITGSSDASIRNAVSTDILWLIGQTSVKRVILNGKTAEKCFRRFYSCFSLPTVTLPSSSPANAAWSLERLITAWRHALTSDHADSIIIEKSQEVSS